MKKTAENGDAVELGNVNQAFENDSGKVDTNSKFSPSSGFPTTNPASEKGNVDISDDANDEDGGPERQQWSHGVEFLMSCIAMSVGLGNIWRFPYTAFRNGGGAFLIPYIVVLFLIGKPLYYIEMSIGQFVSGGPIKAWSLSPALKGIGYGQTFATVLVLSYYCSLMALTAFYFVNSFAADLPWSTCAEEWDMCFDSKKTEDSVNASTNYTDRKSSSELYFYKYVLNEPDSIEDGIGIPDWRLTLCLLFSWITVFLVIIRGVKSSGKAAYFLALFPYVIMIALLVRGATLPGAGKGILFFIEPQWEELLNPQVWYNAVTQAFFSLNICFGTLIMYSSYNEFNHNVYRDAMIVTTLDTCTSLLAGCTIFSILGNLMYELGTDDIQSVVQGGTGLAFVSYPDAITKFDVVPQLFAVLFFLMLYTLGVGSAVALVGAVNTIICDSFPSVKYWVVATSSCIFGFLVGLVYVTPGGQYVLTLVDFYGANFTVFILGTIEMIGIAWVYGVDNLAEDLEFMLGKKLGIYWRLCWGFITPVLMLVILVYSIAIMQPETYHDEPFPTSAYGAGWFLLAFGVLQLPLWGLFVIFKKRDGSLLEAIKSAFQHSELWRPMNNKTYKEWKEFKETRRRELELIMRDETLWQKVVRKVTGNSPLRSRVTQSGDAPDKF
ncbi:sodium-dependent nutrient amino acid transporter 1-like isoform X1 [Zootermopsis nevadensis]|uniref:sodium-dependent nutrient amino acid transporter 1-like isoform X1 n=1 Tax=Zootermopsis nevadensis TaxID=136037 RepID=UPI000B8E8A4E|nr:sodium-dependent nutrient amino acid transporter 1-like isoform X1 [Zootermopsis nevadensis]XP_021912917.1 sodium-dependent nutrient amino acid transporter 1-like isoform X1 [Zootermopsis nevadensis]